MKIFTVIIILSVTISIHVVEADDTAKVVPYYGELQDYEGSQIVRIETHYDHQDPPAGSPPRLSTCATEEKSRADASCSEICINRTHRGGSCKNNICLCSD